MSSNHTFSSTHRYQEGNGSVQVNRMDWTESRRGAERFFFFFHFLFPEMILGDGNVSSYFLFFRILLMRS